MPDAATADEPGSDSNGLRVEASASEATQQQEDEIDSEVATQAAEKATPPAKPRYTARTDHQFPISTVAVLADP
ncbi:unnamed protein product [Phytophthora fragariaefolia]|uniref:Unnamed protein product n=1 Tax=Phytophthora fragariaefolia TaxID=1490495 RepID=A0A9W6XC72_9STRA|nr:unnamed protein product [Phytophthora fragariaefolia]